MKIQPFSYTSHWLVEKCTLMWNIQSFIHNLKKRWISYTSNRLVIILCIFCISAYVFKNIVPLCLFCRCPLKLTLFWSRKFFDCISRKIPWYIKPTSWKSEWRRLSVRFCVGTIYLLIFCYIPPTSWNSAYKAQARVCFNGKPAPVSFYDGMR